MKNKGLIFSVLSILFITLFLTYSYDSYKENQRFRSSLRRINERCSNIAANTTFRNALLGNSKVIIGRFLNDNIRSQYDDTIRSFFVVTNDKKIIASAVTQRSKFSKSIAKLSMPMVPHIQKDYLGKNYIYIPQPVFNSDNYVVAVLSINRLKELFSVKEFQIINGELRIKSLDMKGVISKNVFVYILLVLLALCVVSTVIFSQRKIAREIYLSHKGTRHDVASVADNVAETIELIPCEVISGNVKKVDELIEDAIIQLSWLNKLGSQLGYLTTELDLSEVSLNKIFSTFSKEAGIFYSRDALCLKVNIANNLKVLGNENVIFLVLINLIKNCVYHRDQSTQDVYVTNTQDDDYVYLHIKNKGFIKKSLLKNIFKAEVKGKNSLGSGLGLYNSKRQAHMMGGDLTLTCSADRREVIATLKLKKKEK